MINVSRILSVKVGWPMDAANYFKVQRRSWSCFNCQGLFTMYVKNSRFLIKTSNHSKICYSRSVVEENQGASRVGRWALPPPFRDGKILHLQGKTRGKSDTWPVYLKKTHNFKISNTKRKYLIVLCLVRGWRELRSGDE